MKKEELKVYDEIRKDEKIRVQVYKVDCEYIDLTLYQVVATNQGLIQWYEPDRFYCKSYRTLNGAIKKADSIRYQYQVPMLISIKKTK